MKLLPKMDLKVSKEPISAKFSRLNSECDYLFAQGVIGIEDIGFCSIEFAVPTKNWWLPSECPADIDVKCQANPVW